MATFTQTPRLAIAVLWAASHDEKIVVEHLVDLDRRSVTKQMTHFFDLNGRLRLVGMADKTGFACPLPQYSLADALGLSAVHVNRVLRDLREEGLVTFQKGRATFRDYKAVVDFSTYGRTYLDHGGRLLM